MKYRRLGNSGLLVSELALGTMIFGEQSDRSTPASEAQKMINYYLEAGGNHFDLADVYAGGRAEEIVGATVQKVREKIVLTSKVRWPTGSGPNDCGLSRYHIQQNLEASLRRLKTETIDVLYMHGWDAMTPLEESLRTFNDFVSSGKVRYIAVSNFKAWQLMKALGVSDRNGWVRFIAAQYQYSLVVRDIENEFIDLCQVEGLGLIPWGPLGGGFLTGKYKPGEKPNSAIDGRLAVTLDAWEESWVRRSTEHNWGIMQAVNQIVQAHPGSTHSQVAIAWLLTRPTVASVIIGARTLGQLTENLKASDLLLSEEEITNLDNVSAITMAYPYRSVITSGR
jgi:aryl-alcohol dehydrogenase-like predicted oxidoreductase